jgi:peptidase E
VTDDRQIFAFSGVLRADPDGRDSLSLVNHAISLARGEPRWRVCYVPTAVGDSAQAVDYYTSVFADRADVDLTILKLFTQPSVPNVRAHLLGQDVILVEGGSVVNLMAVWRAHGLPAILRECWEAGVVLAGASAGSLCWHLGGPTDSFGDSLAPFTEGLALVPFSNGVHDDFDDQPRRRIYRELISAGALPGGYATEDGVGLHYVGTTLHEAVTVVAGKQAWHVRAGGPNGWQEQPVPARLI